MLKFSIEKNGKYAIIESDRFSEIREHFSVENESAVFTKRINRHIPSRQYAITPTGRFDAPLFSEILKYVLSQGIKEHIEATPEFKLVAAPAAELWKKLPKFTDTPYELSIPLRDYQANIVSKCLDVGRGTIVLATAGGKAQPLYSKIKTPNGWIRMRDVRIGDTVSTPDGGTSTVTQIFPQGKKDVYRITFEDGRATECCLDHLWQVYSHTAYRGWKKGWNIVDVKSLIEISHHHTNKRLDGGMAVKIPLLQGDSTPEQKYSLHPYVVGSLLGDGCMTGATTYFSSSDLEIIKHIQRLLPRAFDLNHISRYDYAIVQKKIKRYGSFVQLLKDIGIHGCNSYNKFIPSAYLNGSYQQRLDLLRGLLDTDGYAAKQGAVSYSTTSKQLAQDVVELVRSLGGISKIRRVYTPTYTYKGVKRVGAKTYTISIIYHTPSELFTLPRKQVRVSSVRRELKLRIASIEKLNTPQECQCIAIDSTDHLYITDNYIVTHNTLTMASLISRVWSFNDPATFKCLLVVPDRGLVTQTYNDFKEYKVPFTYSMWTGDDKLDLSSNVIIANAGILQSENSNVTWTEFVDLVVVDEVHKVRRSNKISDLIKSIKTPCKFGFTGTLPESLLDQWNIIGKIGPILYEKNSESLRKEKYIADVACQIIEVSYKDEPPPVENKMLAYRQEIDFLVNNSFRNNLIGKLAKNTANNCLVLVDYIHHGEALETVLKQVCTNKQVFFIQGSVEIDERERIKQLMERSSDVVVVAISKIFSTGINIKNLHYIVFAGGGKAKIKVVQSIGRGLRLHASKTKLYLLDITDNLKYGNRHAEKRQNLYERERIPFTIKEIKET